MIQICLLSINDERLFQILVFLVFSVDQVRHSLFIESCCLWKVEISVFNFTFHTSKMHLATNQNKILLVKLMLSFHNVKRFFKIRAEPIYEVFRKHPITRGMASYLVIWPVGSCLQQIWSDQEKLDLWKVARFGLYGSLITAPMLYGWIRLTTAMWPNTYLRIAAAKVRYRALQTVS